MKRFLVILMMAFTIPAFAGISANEVGGAGWSNLTEEQKAMVLQQIAASAAKNKGVGPVSVDKVGQWVDVGERIGKMIGGAAKEVGVAVNEFVNTPVGKMAMMIIVWHYMGSTLVHIGGGLLVLVVGFSFILFMLRRVRGVTTEYSPDKTDIFGRARILRVTRDPLHENYAAGYTACAAVVLVASLITMFTF